MMTGSGRVSDGVGQGNTFDRIQDFLAGPLARAIALEADSPLASAPIRAVWLSERGTAA